MILFGINGKATVLSSVLRGKYVFTKASVYIGDVIRLFMLMNEMCKMLLI